MAAAAYTCVFIGIFALADATSQGSCYSLSSHQVECDVPESACSSPNFWYAPGFVSSSSGCCHCEASCENTSDSCDYHDVSKGSCYDMSTHQVNCDVPEPSCAPPNMWYAPGFVSSSSGCCHCKASCQNTSDSCDYHDVPNPASTSTAQPEVWGCYDVQSHSCNCQVAEAECTGTWTRACTDCAGQMTSAASSRSLTLVLALFLWFCASEAGTGCYNVETHQCDCQVTEAQCHQRRGTWTDGCNTCDAASNTHHPQCEKQYSWGCFNSVSHSCECEVAERACDQAVNKTWTHECWSCCRGSSWGCYVPGSGPESGCHCGIYQGACELDFPDATWSHQCYECEVDQDQASVVEGNETGDGSLVVAILVSVSVTAVLASCVAVGIFLACRKKPHGRSPTSENADVVIGRAVQGSKESA